MSILVRMGCVVTIGIDTFVIAQTLHTLGPIVTKVRKKMVFI